MIDLEGAFRALSADGVRFIVVGGVAASIHGSARLTDDLDIVHDREGDNLRRLAEALSPFRPALRSTVADLPFRCDAATLAAGVKFRLATALGDIDLLGEVAGGGGYADLLPRSREVDAFDLPVRCVDLATLVRLKRAAGNPRDLEAIAELEALAEERARMERGEGGLLPPVD